MTNQTNLDNILVQLNTEANLCLEFVRGMTEQQFYADLKTQHAVAMAIHNLGEAASKLIAKYPDFIERNPSIDWISMRGMRNRIAHGYSEIDQKAVWMTCKDAIPEFIEQLKNLSI